MFFLHHDDPCPPEPPTRRDSWVGPAEGVESAEGDDDGSASCESGGSLTSMGHGLAQRPPWTELADCSAFFKPESFSKATLRTKFLHELDKACNIGSTIKAIPKKESIKQIIKWVIFKTVKLHSLTELCKIAFQLEYQERSRKEFGEIRWKIRKFLRKNKNLVPRRN